MVEGKKLSSRDKDLTWQELQDILFNDGTILGIERIANITLMSPKRIRLTLVREAK